MPPEIYWLVLEFSIHDALFQYALSCICLVICISGCCNSADDEMYAAASTAPVNAPSSTQTVLEGSPVKLKTVAYRGGIVKFFIPDSWLEEYEPSGGATFYENSQDSGTLRLSVLQFESKGPSNMMIQDLIQSKHYEPIQHDLAILQETKSTVEDGETLDIYSW